ncbi:hypothetical protein B0H14DRAFT_3871179 [Mycena olivaceomarginata]|nr:hypothetical protein B0H14DRAFT_3871179 [Mycena olivaceomarginata]
MASSPHTTTTAGQLGPTTDVIYCTMYRPDFYRSFGNFPGDKGYGAAEFRERSGGGVEGAGDVGSEALKLPCPARAHDLVVPPSAKNTATCSPPLFKCSTNPRVVTVHCWTAVDVVERMNKPTECFYNKDGNWYYAGVYKAFRLEDLMTKEWEALSAERLFRLCTPSPLHMLSSHMLPIPASASVYPVQTTQAFIKDTLTGRKNTSPQNIYEWYNDNMPERPQVDMMTRDWVVQGEVQNIYD